MVFIFTEKKSMNKYRSIFISDVHLGVSAWQVEILSEWLKNNKAGQYYLVGDIIDFWRLNRKWYWPKSHNGLIKRFIKLAEKRKVYYIPGNHDESIREFIGLDFAGIKIHEEMIHECVNKQKIIVMHGDKFDSFVKESAWIAHVGSVGYEILFKVNPIINRFRKLFGFQKHWSLSHFVKRKVKNATKYIGRYEETLIKYAEQKNCQGVICGHLHAPNIEYYQETAYLNIGDFIESMTILVENHDGTFEILGFVNYKDEQIDSVATINLDSKCIQKKHFCNYK